MKNTINVMLVEDHPDYRETIEFILSKEKDIELISQYGNAELALRDLQDQTILKQPEIILLDLNLPGMSGLEAMCWLKEYVPEVKIIILSQSDREEDILLAVKNGASGYLLKSCSMSEIIQGIHSVSEGGATLESNLARFILKTLQPKLPETTKDSKISEREREILSLIADGLTQKEISNQLGISTYTVTDHLKHIYEKLDVANAPQAISKAYQTGIFSSDK